MLEVLKVSDNLNKINIIANVKYRVTIKERYNVERNCDSPWNFGELLCICGAHHIYSI